MTIFTDFLKNTELAIIKIQSGLEAHSDFREAIGSRDVTNRIFVRSRLRRRRDGLLNCMLSESYGIAEENDMDRILDFADINMSTYIVLNIFGDEHFRSRITDYCRYYKIGSWVHKPSGSHDAYMKGNVIDALSLFDVMEEKNFLYDLVPEWCIRAQLLDDKMDRYRTRKRRPENDVSVNNVSGSHSAWYFLNAIRRNLPFMLITDFPEWEQYRMRERAERIWNTLAERPVKGVNQLSIVDKFDLNDLHIRENTIDMVMDFLLEHVKDKSEENHIVNPTMHIGFLDHDGQLEHADHAIPFSPHNPDLDDTERAAVVEYALDIYESYAKNGCDVLCVMFTDTVSDNDKFYTVICHWIEERIPGWVTLENREFLNIWNTYHVNEHGVLCDHFDSVETLHAAKIESRDDDIPF